MYSFLLNAVSDLGHPDNTPAGYGNGLDINMSDFSLGMLLGVAIGAVLTLLAFLLIKAIKNLKL